MWPIRGKRKKQIEKEKEALVEAKKALQYQWEMRFRSLNSAPSRSTHGFGFAIDEPASVEVEKFKQWASLLSYHGTNTASSAGVVYTQVEPDDGSEACMWCGELFDNETQRDFHEQHCAD